MQNLNSTWHVPTRYLAAAALGVTLATSLASDVPKPVSSTQVSAKPATTVSHADATYLRDVFPIVMGRCSRCHNGQSALPNWLDYKTAFKQREEMKRRVWDSWKGSYYKQPMPAGNSEECQGITEDERTTIKQWVVEGGALGVAETTHPPRSKEERMERGQKLFTTVCSACHQANGQGIPDKFPPLAASDFLNADKNRAIRTLLHGRQGEITVNSHKFNNSMPSLPLNNDDIASALTFVYNSFGNCGKTVTAQEVQALRGKPDADAPGQAPIMAHLSDEKSPFE